MNCHSEPSLSAAKATSAPPPVSVTLTWLKYDDPPDDTNAKAVETPNCISPVPPLDVTNGLALCPAVTCQSVGSSTISREAGEAGEAGDRRHVGAGRAAVQPLFSNFQMSLANAVPNGAGEDVGQSVGVVAGR